MLSHKENYLRVVRFERPDYIPMNAVINMSCYGAYPHEQLFDLMEAHKLLFPGFVRPQGEFHPDYSPKDLKDHPFTDDFGCVWHTPMDGMTGVVTEHPLADWADFDTYQAPDPAVCMGIGPIDWEKEAQRIRRGKENGELIWAGLRHGHTFLQLSDIRGYQNLLMDMMDEEERLPELIKLVEDFNFEIVRRYTDLGVDVFNFGEDLGMQVGPMLSPQLFRKYIKPSYRRMMQYAREQGAMIYMHSDGDIRTLVEDLVDGGVQIVNLQDLVNGIDWIAENLAGKYCIDLDIDRQDVTVYGTPRQIDALIREEVEKIGSRAGGLAMTYGMYPGTPLENANAVFDAMEKYMFYYD